MTPIETRGFELHPWQKGAVHAWISGWGGKPCFGTLEIVTGGGKTLIAIACAAEASRIDPELRLAVVVPTEALAHQWRDVLVEKTSLQADEVGVLGAGERGSFNDRRAVVAVLNTAAKRLPNLARRAQPLMLIVDECHRAGAPSFSRVLDTPSKYRLGLSATPDREELDEDGEPLDFDEQVVGRALGGVVHRFTLRDARLAGWLPRFTLHHHGIALSDEERRRYELLSRRVDEAADLLRALGVETSRSRQLSSRQDEVGEAARSWVRLTGERKDLLYRAPERQRIVIRILAEAVAERGDSAPRAILFHERVDEAVELHAALQQALPDLRIELEHSRLPDSRRREVLQAFRDGDAAVLVSVKSLVEGIDVPAADIGVSVASTSSVRQRVQSLGRVLRRAATSSGSPKTSTMHLIYVADTVDELIYGKADWSDLTGDEANWYWRWTHDAETPGPADGPPLSPRPTEAQAWDALGREVSNEPILWSGVVTGQEYSVSANGVVHNAFHRLVENPQDVASMVEAVRGRPGGRFRVTPEFRLVIVWTAGPDESRPFLAGQLQEPFRVAEENESSGNRFHVEDLHPGDPYLGPADKKGGSYRLGQRGGGIIERRTKGGREVALTSGTSNPDAEEGARSLLQAWQEIDRSTSRFFVNSLGHAWYEKAGGRKFLAVLPSGLIWPSDLEGE